MSFEAFELAIVSPALKTVARHWNETRGARVLPGWSDIRPGAIAPQLSIVWSYRYERETDSFIGRLAGERIEAIFGKSMRGLPMKQAYPEDEFPELFARSKRVLQEPSLMRGHGVVFRHLHRYGTGERIIMPLGEDGVTGDGIFGATEYNVAAEATRRIHSAGETIEWYALA